MLDGPDRERGSSTCNLVARLHDYLKDGRGGGPYRLCGPGRAGPEQEETVLLLLVSGQGFHSSEVRMCLNFTLALD